MILICYCLLKQKYEIYGAHLYLDDLHFKSYSKKMGHIPQSTPLAPGCMHKPLAKKVARVKMQMRIHKHYLLTTYSLVAGGLWINKKI